MVTALAMSKTLDVWNRAPARKGCAFAAQTTPDQPKVKVLGLKTCGIPGRLGPKEAVFRPRQAQIFPQGPSLIFAPENPAFLQFRHHLVDEVVEARRQE